MILHRILAPLLVLSLAVSASAQTSLRWKLAAGDKLRVQVAQATTSDVAFSGKRATTQIDLTLNLQWNVLSADDQQARIEQSIERLQFKMTPAKGAAITYDSSDNQRLTGAAKDIAAALRPLIDSPVGITMNTRGAILAAEPANVADDAASADDERTAGDTSGLSRSQLQQLLKQSLVILPEKPVSEGDTWTSGANITSAVGDFKQETTFTLAGTVEQDGRSLSNITSVTKLEPAAASGGPAPPAGAKAPVQPKLKSHEQSGKILFDAEAGRVATAESSQALVTERLFRETTIVVTLSSKQTTTITPADQ